MSIKTHVEITTAFEGREKQLVFEEPLKLVRKTLVLLVVEDSE